MASFTNTKAANKAMAVARLVSKKTGHTISWVNLTEQFAKAVFACEVKNVSAEDMQRVLPKLFENDFVEVMVTDLTEELRAIPATDF